ncbi:MAG: hypothetical protein ACOC9S_04920, partial [Planctomycetota bacterium]
MRAFLRYLREHPRQRRLLTATLALAAGLLAAVSAYPLIDEYLVIRRLGSDDRQVRTRAIARATEMASENDRMLRRLEAALETEDDEEFLAVAEVLRNLREFHTDSRDREAIDRLRALRLAEPLTGDADEAQIEARVLLLMRIISEGRDNAYVRRALSAVAESPLPRLREPAAILAARLGESDTLGMLLDDDDSAVRTTAALSAAAGQCTALAGKLRDVFRTSEDTNVVAAAGYALAILNPATASEVVLSRLLETDDADLRDRLLLTTPLMDGGESAVAEIMERVKADGGFAPAAALVSAARMKLASAGAPARKVLKAAAAGSEEITESQVMAAMEVARALEMDVREELNAYCRRHWSDRLSLSNGIAGRLLAEQTTRRGDGEDVSEAIETLRRAAIYHRYVQSVEGEGTGTPRASAEAAAGLWLLDAEDAESTVRRMARRESPQAGDTIAWRLAQIDRRRAFELALTMLPEPGAAPERRVYNDNERACGAMLLALSARSTEQQNRAKSRIKQRLDHVNEPFAVRASLQCALAALGDDKAVATVREFLTAGAVPPRRAVTALLSAGEKAALDWLLWNRSLDDAEVLRLLIDDELAEVLAVTAGELPRVDPAAGTDLRPWQLEILRVHYVINRGRLRV